MITVLPNAGTASERVGLDGRGEDFRSKQIALGKRLCVLWWTTVVSGVKPAWVRRAGVVLSSSLSAGDASPPHASAACSAKGVSVKVVAGGHVRVDFLHRSVPWVTIASNRHGITSPPRALIGRSREVRWGLGGAELTAP